MASSMWDGPDQVWDPTDNGRLKQNRNAEQTLSRPTKPIHSAQDGWRGFFGRLAERMLGKLG